MGWLLLFLFIAQAGLELNLVLPQPPWCWDCGTAHCAWGPTFLYHIVLRLASGFPDSSGSKSTPPPRFLQGRGRRWGLGSDFFLEWCGVEESGNPELWEGGFRQAFALVLSP